MSRTLPRITRDRSRGRSFSCRCPRSEGIPTRHESIEKPMSEVPLHRLYLHYSELPYSLRVLYTAVLLVLGLAYVFAGIYLYHTYAGRAGGSPMVLSYQDVVVAYRGSGQGSRLEAALRGPMRTMLPADQIAPITTWIKEG